MKQKLLAIVLAAILLAASVSPVLAGGDQVRGDRGQGYVYQMAGEPPHGP
jgi:hypothetical protein